MKYIILKGTYTQTESVTCRQHKE